MMMIKPELTMERNLNGFDIKNLMNAHTKWWVIATVMEMVNVKVYKKTRVCFNYLNKT